MAASPSTSSSLRFWVLTFLLVLTLSLGSFFQPSILYVQAKAVHESHSAMHPTPYRLKSPPKAAPQTHPSQAVMPTEFSSAHAPSVHLLDLPGELQGRLQSQHLIALANWQDSCLISQASEELYTSPLSLNLLLALWFVDHHPLDQSFLLTQRALGYRQALLTQERQNKLLQWQKQPSVREHSPYLQVGQRYHLEYLLHALLLEQDSLATYALLDSMAPSLEEAAQILLAFAKRFEQDKIELSVQKSPEDPAAPNSDLDDSIPYRKQIRKIGQADRYAWLLCRNSSQNLALLASHCRKEAKILNILQTRDRRLYRAQQHLHFRNRSAFAWPYFDRLLGACYSMQLGQAEFCFLFDNPAPQVAHTLLLHFENRHIPISPEDSALQDALQLEDFIHKSFEIRPWLIKGQVIAEAQKKQEENISLVATSDLNIVSSKTEDSVLEQKVQLYNRHDRSKRNEIDQGILGKLRIVFRNGLVISVPLKAAGKPSPQSWLKQLQQQIQLYPLLARSILGLSIVFFLLLLGRCLHFFYRLRKGQKPAWPIRK